MFPFKAFQEQLLKFGRYGILNATFILPMQMGEISIDGNPNGIGELSDAFKKRFRDIAADSYRLGYIWTIVQATNYDLIFNWVKIALKLLEKLLRQRNCVLGNKHFNKTAQCPLTSQIDLRVFTWFGVKFQLQIFLSSFFSRQRPCIDWNTQLSSLLFILLALKSWKISVSETIFLWINRLKSKGKLN